MRRGKGRRERVSDGERVEWGEEELGEEIGEREGNGYGEREGMEWG